MALAKLSAALWAVSHSLLYGYHISSLNGVQDALLCSTKTSAAKFGLNGCLALSDTSFGVAVTIFTLGGLVGSLSADIVTRRFGRIGTLRVSEMIFIVGTALVGITNGLALLITGRILVGIASGLVLVTVPLYLSEMAPAKYNTLFGTLHQMSIGVGMIFALGLAYPFSKEWEWRYILLVGLSIAAALLGLSFLMGMVGRGEEGEDESRGGSEDAPLLGNSSASRSPLNVKELFTTDNTHIRRALLAVIVAQCAQQICGISPVMYFSTRILSPVFGGNSKLVALVIPAIGIPFNFLPGILPQSFGTKRILALSAAGTTLFTALLGIGLNLNNRALSGVGVILFVIFFSIGLGPVAWVVLSEVMPQEGRTAGGSIGVSVNWITNFIAGSSFLPLQNALRNGDRGEGNVFFVFTATSLIAFVAILFSFRKL